MDIRDGPVRHVVLERPDKQNPITADTARELAEALSAVDATSHDAVVVRGQGDAFSAGGDIEAMAEREETTREAYERVRETLGRVAEALLTAPVPVVAKVDGDAVGAGLTLVAASDFALATDRSRFGASFVNVGLVPDMGGTVVLPRLVGLRRAKELAFTGRLLDATEADDLDIVSESVPVDDLDDRLDSLLETLRDRPTETIALAKEAIHGNLGRGWREGLDREAHLQAQAYDTDAHAEGVEAFLEGRRPDFE